MVSRTILAVLFVVAGSLHFFVPQVYLKIMPPQLPAPWLLVQLSGAAEILGGVGLLVPFTRPTAAWALIALLIAVLPANVYMAVAHVRFPGFMGWNWAQWVRIPLQLPLIGWVWLYTKR